MSHLMKVVVVGGVMGVTGFGCGDVLVSGEYRGDALFFVKGTIEPERDLSGAEFLCSASEVDCTNECHEVYEDRLRDDFPEEDFDDIDELSEEDRVGREEAFASLDRDRDACFDECYQRYSTCLEDNQDTGFDEAYYDTQDAQRIAILWANPGAASKSVLYQRTQTETEFPARYSFSVFQPPHRDVLFAADGVRYAFGLVVSFIDRNNDGQLDIGGEPIIGLNMNHGVFYSTGDGARETAGYSLRELDECIVGPGAPPESDQTWQSALSITGTTPYLFSALPDVGCDESRSEWRLLCEMTLARNHCADRAAASDDIENDAICDLCLAPTSG